MAKKKQSATIRKDFKSMQPIKVDITQLSLDKICYGTINSCEVVGFITPEGYISVSKSWLEVLLILIDTVIENSKSPSEYKRTFMKYKVTSQTFNIDTDYGIISLDPNRQYQVYQIYNRKLYLETLLQVSDIFQALIGLAQSCGYTLDKFKLDLRSKDYYEKMDDFFIIDDNQIISDISGWTLVKNEDIQVEEFLIFSERLKSHSFHMAAWVFISELFENYGDESDYVLDNLPEYEGVLIEVNTGQEQSDGWTPLKGNKYLMQLKLDDDKTLDYIHETMLAFGIDNDNFQIKVRRN